MPTKSVHRCGPRVRPPALRTFVRSSWRAFRERVGFLTEPGLLASRGAAAATALRRNLNWCAPQQWAPKSLCCYRSPGPPDAIGSAQLLDPAGAHRPSIATQPLDSDGERMCEMRAATSPQLLLAAHRHQARLPPARRPAHPWSNHSFGHREPGPPQSRKRCRLVPDQRDVLDTYVSYGSHPLDAGHSHSQHSFRQHLRSLTASVP